MKKVSDARRDVLASEWDELKESTDLLHVLIDDKIIGVKESYFDNEILNNCTKAYKNAAQIVGETMGSLGHYIGDTYLDYRFLLSASFHVAGSPILWVIVRHIFMSGISHLTFSSS